MEGVVIWGIEKTVSPEICFLMLLDHYMPGKWMPGSTQSDPGFKKTLRWYSLRSICMLFDLEDSRAIIRETDCLSSGQEFHMTDKTLLKKIKFKSKLQHLFSKCEAFILWQLCWDLQRSDAGETTLPDRCWYRTDNGTRCKSPAQFKAHKYPNCFKTNFHD